MSNLKSKLAAALVLTLVPAAWSAEPLLTFGTESLTAGKCATHGPNAAVPTLVEVKDSMQLTTPNWWSALIQVEKFTPVSLAGVAPTDFLTLTVKGHAGGPSPKLKVLLFSPDWQKKAEWEFDLSGIKPDEFTTIKAGSSLGEPLGEGNSTLSSVGVVQMATRGNDNQAWNLDIQSIGVAAASDKK
jgi:hypothetical protein